MSPSASIIVTTYNSPGYLRRVLAGYATQSVYPNELIVADDGSGSETAEVIKLFKKSAPFPVSHVWHEDLGFRAARIRNEAIKIAMGEYIIMADGDCIPHHRFIEDHLRLCSPGWFVQGKRMLVGRKASESFLPGGNSRLIWLCLRGRLSGCHHVPRVQGFAGEKKGLHGIKTCNMALFKKDLLAVNGFNEDFIGWGREDSELAARLFASGMRRKDPPFSAIVFHLWHKENSRAELSENDRLLAETIRSGISICKNGIRKLV